MTDQEVLETFSRILGDVLARGVPQLAMTTRREDVPGWDSFAYVTFIVAVEVEFGIKFGVAEIDSFENVGAIVRRTEALISRRS